MIDRQQIIVHDHALGGLRPFECVDPAPVGARPVPPVVVQPSAEKQLAQAMAAPLQILTRVIPRTAQIAHRFFFGRRRSDLGQQPRAQQLGEFPRIAAIGFDPFARLPR